MTDIFEKLLDLSEIQNFPSKIQKFIHVDKGGHWRSGWGHISWEYNRAFEALAKKALEGRKGGDPFSYPLFYLARHSIELSLKATILEYAETDEKKPSLDGHGLLHLWNELGGYLERWGVPNSDEWGAHVHRLIGHLHESDPDGERYRYPSNRRGKEFKPTYVEIEGLIRAHWHITMYLDGCSEMRSAGYRG